MMRLPFLGTAGDVTEVRSKGDSAPGQRPRFFYSQNVLEVRTTHHQPGVSLVLGMCTLSHRSWHFSRL